MAITIYNDVIMPNSVIAAGVRGKNLRKNERAMNQGGYETVNVIWTRTLRQFELGIVPMLREQWQTIEGLYEITDAGAYGFLMQDPKDNAVTTSEGLLQPMLSGASIGTIGLGYGIPIYQLYKRISSVGTTRTKDRIITRPKSPSALLRGGVAVTAGTSAGNVAINYDTGLATFVADTSQALTSITAGATTVLNFATGTGIVAAMSVGQRVYLSGLSGTAATALNTKSHAITAKGATSLTVSTVTTGLAATGGTAYKYPQASEALTWSGGIYVPVHFVNDSIDWELVRAGQYDQRLLSGPSVMLQEIRE